MSDDEWVVPSLPPDFFECEDGCGGIAHVKWAATCPECHARLTPVCQDTHMQKMHKAAPVTKPATGRKPTKPPVKKTAIDKAQRLFE